jgi:hypothetical protein
MLTIDKPIKKFLQSCNLAFNDKGLIILRTQISYLCSLSKCLLFFHNLHIGEEHKAHVVQVNNKTHNLKRLSFFN